MFPLFPVPEGFCRGSASLLQGDRVAGVCVSMDNRVVVNNPVKSNTYLLIIKSQHA